MPNSFSLQDPALQGKESVLALVPGRYRQTKSLSGTWAGLGDSHRVARVAGADICGLLAGIYTDHKICWEDAEGDIGLLKRNSSSFCGETKMEILTLSEDQEWAAELGLTLMSGEQKKGFSGGACPQFIHFLPTKTVALPGEGSSKAHLILSYERSV